MVASNDDQHKTFDVPRGPTTCTGTAVSSSLGRPAEKSGMKESTHETNKYLQHLPVATRRLYATEFNER